MPKRAPFLLFASSFWALLTSGAFAPVVAEPLSVAPVDAHARDAGSFDGAGPELAPDRFSYELGLESAEVDLAAALEPAAPESTGVVLTGVQGIWEPEGDTAQGTPGLADAWADADTVRDPWAEALGEAARLTRIDADPWAESVAEALRVSSRAIDPWAEAFAESARIPAPPDRSGYVVVINEQVQAFIERFTGSRRDVVGLWLDRSRKYLSMIRETLREHGLPEDLAFVPMIESGFNPLAVSRAGAKGLWQFMAGTARRYGLRVDQWVDERLDPEKSTVAAAAYLRDLYRQFGSWALAKAAYNAGEVRIVKAIRSVGTDDFWTLAKTRFIVRETKDFVPAIHAATVIGRDPSKFGFDPSEPKPVEVETVKVPPRTRLARLAAAARIPARALEELNPVLVRGMTPPGAPYELRVPAGTRDAVLAALRKSATVARAKARPAAVSGSAGKGPVHVVAKGETVTSIARQHKVSIDDVLRWNGLRRDSVIRPGDRLRVSESHLAARDTSIRTR